MRRHILPVLVGVVLATMVIQCTTHPLLWRVALGDPRAQSGEYLADVIKLVGDNYVDPDGAKTGELTNAALRGMMDSLDPHSEFLEPRSYQAMQEEIRGRFGGIGVQVEWRQGRAVVVAPMAGSPGERAGILRGDQIVRIEGEELPRTVGLTDIVNRLRGDPGTTVHVGLYRPDEDRTLDVSIVREVIRVEAVNRVSMLSDGVGYVQINEFTERTGEEFRAALDTLKGEGMSSLVIDLRNNPGGLLDAAVDVASPFFRRGELVVYTQGRTPEDREEFRSSNEGATLDLPIAVLINAGSASAAEIVAGALKDTHRAVVVGERSFGKGSVQTIFRLRNGAGIRLTTARYYTPSGVTIHEVGVSPDVEVVMTPEEDLKLRTQRNRPDITNPSDFEERFGFAPIEDRQLKAALDVLAGARLLESRVGSAKTL